MTPGEKSEIQSSRRMIDMTVAAVLGLGVFCLWAPTLGIRFYQDDYWSLFLSQNPYLGLIPAAIPWDHVWRPLGQFAPFFVIRRFFGLNPFVFHLTNLSIHLLNGFLVYRLALSMMERREFALVTTIFYTLNSVHTRMMQWAVGIESLLSATWYLLAFSMYLRFRQHASRSAYWLSLGAFTGSLLTKEWSISLVPLLLWYELVCDPSRGRLGQRAKWKTIMGSMAGYCIVLFTYVPVRMFLLTFPSTGQYALNLIGPLAVSNLAEYLRFAVLATSEIGPSLRPMLVGSVVTLLIFMLFLSWMLRLQLVVFGLGWFVITLIPVLFIPRLQPYYLVIPLVGFAITISALAKVTVQILPFGSMKRWAPLLLASLLSSAMLIITAKEVRTQQEALWLTKPQRFVDCTLAYLSNRWPSLPAHSLLFFLGLRPEEYLFLAFGSSVNVVYNDNTIRTAFIPSRYYLPFVNTKATPSPLDKNIVDRETLNAFCKNKPSLRLQ
jgi:hypothetical protein